MKKTIGALTVGSALAFSTTVFADSTYDPGVKSSRHIDKQKHDRQCRY